MMLTRSNAVALGDTILDNKVAGSNPAIVAQAQAALTAAGFSADCSEEYVTGVGYERLCSIDGGPKAQSADAIAQYGTTLPQYMIDIIRDEVSRLKTPGAPTATPAGIYIGGGQSSPGAVTPWETAVGGNINIPAGVTPGGPGTGTTVVYHIQPQTTQAIPVMNANPPSAAQTQPPNPQPGVVPGTSTPAATTMDLTTIASGLPWWVWAGAALAGMMILKGKG